jgi:hypothetical protein
MIIVVAPDGTDAYPKYIVDFQEVFSVSFKEELEAILSPELPPIPSSAKNWCAFIWQQSPQVLAYETLARSHDLPTPIRHYLIFGGDDIVEVICASEPKIEKVTEPRSLHATYEI